MSYFHTLKFSNEVASSENRKIWIIMAQGPHHTKVSKKVHSVPIFFTVEEKYLRVRQNFLIKKIKNHSFAHRCIVVTESNLRFPERQKKCQWVGLDWVGCVRCGAVCVRVCVTQTARARETPIEAPPVHGVYSGKINVCVHACVRVCV